MLRTLAALALLTVTAHAQTSPPPNCNAPEHRAFDFWIGEWDVYTTGTNDLAGRSSIRSENGGCVITEQWSSLDGSNYTGRSINIYDRQTGHWEQVYADSTGELTHFVGGPYEGGMRLTDAANVRTGINNGNPFQVRMTFTANPDGTVRQHGETSSVGGGAWTSRYDLTYRRRPS